MNTFLKDKFSPFVIWYFVFPGTVYLILINHSFELFFDASLVSSQNIIKYTQSIIYFIFVSFIIGTANLAFRCILLKLKGDLVKKCLSEFGENYNNNYEIDAKMFMQLIFFAIVFSAITILFIFIGNEISKL
ncbi:MAG: hypothetical protein KAT05_15705 [Spirochaetes bacterium]|nr:hypothetical protein [Spirochaetota bacterium]